MQQKKKRSTTFNIFILDMDKGEAFITTDILAYPPQTRGATIQNPFVNIVVEGHVTGTEPYTNTIVPLGAGEVSPNHIPQGDWVIWCDTATCRYMCITSRENLPFTSQGFFVSAGSQRTINVPVGASWYIGLLKGTLTMNGVHHSALKELQLISDNTYDFTADTDVVVTLIKMD